MIVKILSNDPGKSNYAYSVVTVSRVGEKLDFSVLENGMISTTVTQIKESKILRKELSAYSKTMKTLERLHKPNCIAAERYMTRGIRGPLVEQINLMLGMLIARTTLPIKLIPAVTWKTAIKREGIDLKGVYKSCKATPHQIDATLIGIYTGLQGFKIKGFTGFKPHMKRIIEEIETTSVTRLINRKIKCIAF